MAGFFKGLYCFSRCRWWLTLHFICGSSFFLTDLLLFSHIFPIALLQTFYSVQWSGAAPPLTATNTTNTTNNNTDNKNSILSLDVYGLRVGRVSPRIRSLQDRLRRSHYRNANYNYALYDDEAYAENNGGGADDNLSEDI